MSEHGINGMNQVEAGIHESAVEIEDEQLNLLWVEMLVEPDHSETSG
jgi:hypothetical protein